MKVAVVGSGVSGLAATWLLNEHSDHEVHLYEADNRTGGHANTTRFIPPGKEWKDGVDVDTGFIVFNPDTYPNFIRFLKRYSNITILKTNMTFSVSRNWGSFEWAGHSLRTMFCQTSRVLDPNMWRLIYDIFRFNASARRLLIGRDNLTNDITIGDYLHQHGYSDAFRENYLNPMIACIWNTPPDTATLEFPARTLLQFLNNHHFLQVTGMPKWLTIQGGSRVYVDTILSSLPAKQLHISTPVESLSTGGEPGIRLKTSNGQTEIYDHVILACHSDTSLSILRAGEGLTADEERILTGFKWNRNKAVLHSDTTLMPKRKIAWSCWNFLALSKDDKDGKKNEADLVSLTYNMNQVQHIAEEKYGPVLVTLNPPVPPKEDLVLHRYDYDHPVMDTEAVRSQRDIASIQGQRGISYAGAYLAYGFHEDGFTSGMRAVADHIDGVRLPFDIQYPDREPASMWVAHVFDLLEVTGIRTVVGALLSVVLASYRLFFGLFFKLYT